MMPPFLASHGSVLACPEVARSRETEGRDRKDPYMARKGAAPAEVTLVITVKVTLLP